ncbi:MAG: hypothetical protein II567_01290 [Candidatus Riflebacteria bacterium]|nr:hypothetical protein [Candidatus Riflebacteria bacterium]
MQHKKQLHIIFISLIFSQVLMSAQSQTIYRYVYPNQNRKNDSQIKPSPYASGYYNYKPIEFSYEPVPTESMKEKAKRVLDSLPVAQEESEEEDIEKILGGMNFDSFSFGEQSTIIKELEEEAKTAIAKQETEAEKALLAKRKTNVASYAASVEAKKQRDKEAELAAQNPESPEQQPENPWGEWGEWSEEESDSSGSVEITYGKDGKIKIKAPSSNNNQPPTPAPIASATIKP